MIYTIDKGDRDWKPVDGFDVFRVRDVRVSLKVDNSMMFNYIDPDTGVFDSDAFDWKKVGGVSFVNWRNFWNIWVKTSDAAMMAWRWNPKLNVFEICLYVHMGGDTIKFERPDQVVRIKYNPDNEYDWVHLDICGNKGTLYQGDEEVNYFPILSRFRPSRYSRIGAWYGGANNSPGKWGGRAPKDMTCEIEFKKL